MKPILSICIPTYNRASYLEKTIDSIIKTNEFKCGKIEVVVSDNCSNDSTELLLKRYNGFSNISYRRNDKNVLDGNFFRAIKAGRGLVRKLWNDTLIMNPKWAEYVCDLVGKLSNHRPLLFFTNKGDYDCAYMDANEFVDSERELVTWIGGFAVWENQCELLDEEGVDLHLWQTVQIFKLLQDMNRVVVVNGDMATINAVKRKNVSYGIYKVFYHNFIEIILEKQVRNSLITLKTYEHVRRAMLYEFFSSMILDYENTHSCSFTYSSEENLIVDLQKKYCKERYYDDFLRYLCWQRLNRENKWNRSVYKIYYKLRHLFG